MGNFDVKSIDTIQLMCNSQMEKFASYEAFEYNNEFYLRPDLKVNKRTSLLQEHINENLSNHTEHLMDKASDAILKLMKIREIYTESNESLLNYKTWPVKLKDKVLNKVLEFVNEFGQLGFLFHIVYDYVAPEISLMSDHVLPTVSNPFYFAFKDNHELKNPIMSNLIDYKTLLDTFFPDFKQDLNTQQYEAAMGVEASGVDLSELVAQPMHLMNQYSEPLFYYLAAIEILYSAISDNANDLILISQSTYENGTFKIKPEMTFKNDVKTSRVLFNLSFKSLFDFLMFVIASSRIEGKGILRKCESPNCNRIFLAKRSDKKYCDSNCKKSANNAAEYQIRKNII